jgi:hypothetical protein
MTRRAFITAFCVATTAKDVTAAESPVQLSAGHLSASDHELHDGWFAIAQSTAVRLTPESPGWLHLKQRLGTTGSLWWRAD